MYAAVNTRSDVAFATGQLARVVQCPNEEQVVVGMRVAKYLGQTATVGLQYSAAAQRRQKGADGVDLGRLFLTAFSDASYASEPEDMTSVGGFIFCVGGGPIAWESKKKVDQALSSVESEYMALFCAILQRFGFQFSSPQPTSLSTGHSLSDPPLDESVEPSGLYPKLVGCLIYLMTTLGMGLVLGGQASVVFTGHSDASWADDQATQHSSQGFTLSLGFGFVLWRSTHSSSVFGSSCEAEIYAGAMDAQELRWLTYLLTDLEKRPRSALLQQRRQLRLSYVASRTNTADVFTKALGSGDYQRVCNALGLVPTLPHLLVA
ncbi:unnamed protein product [Closterium sp. NIES-53]